MSIHNPRSRSNLTGRRGEFACGDYSSKSSIRYSCHGRQPKDVGYDLLVAFANEKAGTSTFAVEVKSTQQPLGSHFSIQRSIYDHLAHSNVPGLLLFVDVKRSRLYYAWLKPSEKKGHGDTVSVPLVEINETTKEELKRQFQRANGGVAVAG